MIVEELVSKLGLEIDGGALATLEKFRGAIASGLGGIATAAAAATAALAAAVGTAAHAADQIGDVSEKLGVAPKALQELKFAAERTEVSFEGLQQGLKFLAKNAVEAADGNKELASAFGGVSLRDAQGRIRASNELLVDLADKFAALPDAASKTNLAIKIFGRAGSELVPLLQRGSAGIQELSDRAAELGVVFSDETVIAAGEFDERLKDVRDAFTGLRNALGVPFIEAFGEGLRAVSKALVAMRPLIAAIVRGIKMVASVFIALGKGIAAVGASIAETFGLSKLDGLIKFQTLMDIVSALVAGLIVLAIKAGVTMAAAGIQAAASWLLAAAPFIALGLLIGLLVDELYNFIEGNDTLLGQVIKWAEAFNPAGNPVLEFFKSAVALIFDLTDPAKWTRFLDNWTRVLQSISALTISAFSFLGQRIAELIAGGLLKVGEKIPFLRGILSAGAGLVSSAGESLGQFGAAAGQVGGGLFGGGAASPEAAGALPSSPNISNSRAVTQQNNITINGANMSLEQLASTIDDHLQSRHQEALASMPR